MSRSGSGDVIERPAESNIYTVLVVAATIASLLAILVVYMRAKDVLGGLLSAS